MNPSKPPERTPEYRADIDGLRAIAITLVLLFHFYPQIMPGGFAGVDVFFTISGYLITRILLRELAQRNFSILEFYKRRAQRLLPALLSVVIPVFIFGWYVLFQDEFRLLGRHVFAGTLFFINAFLYSESGYFDPLSKSKPLLHLWSLSVEEQFYLIWPVFIFVLYRTRKLTLQNLALAAALSFAANFLFTNTAVQFFSPLSRFWEFALGGLVANFETSNFFKPSATRPDTKSLWAYAGLLLMAIGIYFSVEDNSRQPLYVLPVLLGVAILLITGGETLIAEYLLGNRVMRAVGKISYPLYLWHWPVLVFARMLDLDSKTARHFELGLALILAVATYYLCERPLRFGKWNRQHIVFGLISVAMVVSSLGLAVEQSDGKWARSRILSDKTIGVEFGKPIADGSCQLLTHKAGYEDWCDRGDAVDRDPNVLIIGDSFATTYGGVMRGLAVQNPELDLVFRVYARGRCPSLLNYGPKYCREIVGDIYRYIRETPSIQTVVLATRWYMYTDGLHYNEENHEESGVAFARALKASLLNLKSQGKKIVVFWSPPLARSPQYCVDRWSKFAVRENCSFMAKQARLIEADARKLLIPFFENQGIPVFDPFKYFCEGPRCRLLDGRKALYGYDGLHMDPNGGEFLATKAREELLQLLF